MKTIFPFNIPAKYYPLLLLTIIYVVSIARAFLKLNEIIGCLKTLTAYLSSASISKSPYDAVGFHLEKRGHYDLCLNDVLVKFPVIEKYSGYYTGTLEYGAPDITNYRTAATLYNELSMKRNYIYQDFKSSFNPIHAVKTLFTIPSSLIEWIGFNPSAIVSRVVNIIGWIVSFILGLYSEEIKALITALLQNLTK